jgi:dipeptidyl aminopeptidase/acylaminoacyl peptidase
VVCGRYGASKIYGSKDMRGIAKFSTWMASAAALALVPGAAYALEAGEAAGGEATAAPSDQIVVEGKLPKQPTEVFGKKSNLRGIRISPNGDRMLLQRVYDGREYLTWMDIATGKSQLVVAAEEFREAGDRTATSWRWVGNDTIVISVASRENVGGQRGDFSRIIAYDVNTKKITQLAWDGAGGSAADIQYIDHDAGTLMLERTSIKDNRTSTWNLPEVVNVDVKTGKYTYVMRTNPIIGGYFTDQNGVVRAAGGYNADNGKQRILYRSDSKAVLKTVTNEADKNFTGGGIQPLYFLDEPNMALVSSNHDGFAKIYRTDMTNPKASMKLVFQSKGYDVGGPITSFGGKRVVGYSVTEARARAVYTDPLYKGVQEALEQEFGKGNVSIFNSDRTEEKFAVYAARPDQAGSFYLFDTKTGGLKLIGHRVDAIGDRTVNPVSSFRYKASDGEEIEAIITMPRHRKSKTNLPLVILTHGGPFGPRDEVTFDPWAQSVAELGYVVVQPNYRGSGGYGAAWIKKGRDNGFGLRMQDDLDDVITHLAGQGMIDPKRVCMMGWSYGGYASARAAQRNPEKYRCTIAGAGVYDLQLMKAYDVGYLGNFGSNYLAKGAVELDTVSPAKNAKGKWAPIMIVHGVRDQRVPVEQARVLVSALKSSGKKQGVDFEYLEQPKNTHNLPYDDVSIEWLKAVENWLEKHNPAYIPTDMDKPVMVGEISPSATSTAVKTASK